MVIVQMKVTMVKILRNDRVHDILKDVFIQTAGLDMGRNLKRKL